MIYFTRVTYQNFLGIGDIPVEIDLCSHRTTLIIGANGSGKSCLLDALSYGLFNKPHRNINKPQLINSINDKNCLVTVEFEIGSDKYIVKRGMRPGIFEIWKNGHMLNQNSKSRDYQKVLEQNILKLNHKSFHQIVVLGSSSFIPFMQLPKWHRREVIEDLLDISIFSKMNQLLKNERGTLKNNSSSLDMQLDSYINQAKMQRRHIKKLREISKQGIDRVKDEIAELEQEVSALQKKQEMIKQEIEDDKFQEIQEKSKLEKYMQRLRAFEYKASSKKSGLTDKIEFYHEHDICPTCSQAIEPKLKASHLVELNEELKSIVSNSKKLDKEMEKTKLTMNRIDELIADHSRLSNELSHLQFKIDTIRKDIQKKQEAGDSLDTHTDIIEANTILQDLLKQIENSQNEKATITETLTYHSLMEELLKDSGIKTKVVKQYLPVINRLINEYLQTFDFFVSFTLNDEFVESIRSRHRDDFSYSSFSEGEKSRIDLALMFTWRQIAKMKNSTSTNLLLLDEIMDSSLDEIGLQALRDIFYKDMDSNIIVISHRGENKDASEFQRVLEVTKEDLFSTVKEIQL